MTNSSESCSSALMGPGGAGRRSILLAAPKDGLGSVPGLLERKAKLRGMCSISVLGKHVPGESGAAAV